MEDPYEVVKVMITKLISTEHFLTVSLSRGVLAWTYGYAYGCVHDLGSESSSFSPTVCRVVTY